MRGYGWAQYNLAGWSSLVARWVHIPKAVGSNPTPATFFLFINKVMRTIRLITASILMMFARLIKILTIAVSPKDLKEDFRDMI